MDSLITKKSVNIPTHLMKRIERIINSYPGLNFTLIVNQALEQWLNGNHEIKLCTPAFIKDYNEGFGPKG